MRSHKLQSVRQSIASMLALLVVGLGPSGSAWAQQSNEPPVALKERVVLPKPASTVIDPQKSERDIIVLKFREGAKIRWRDGFRAVNLDNLSDRETKQLGRANLDVRGVLLNLEAVNNLTVNKDGLHIERLFSRPEEELDQEKLADELESHKELADLNLHYHLYLDEVHVNEAETLIDRLNALDIVEIAYPQPIYSLPQVDSPATPGSTPNLVNEQGYLEVANSASAPTSNGIDARYAWTLNGGRGIGIRIVDVEYDWRDGHEDLPAVFWSSGERSGVLSHRNHGTAVLGELRSIDNSYGTTGIVPLSQIGVSHPYRQVCNPTCHNDYNVADAINRSRIQLAPGDMLLIEQQVSGPTTGVTCDSACDPCGTSQSQFGFIPVEYNAAEYDAITSLTAPRRVVVEAGGNGQMNLGDARYDRRFDRTFRDSGAIIVGAGDSVTRTPLCYTSAGDRVDVQGWGNNIVTLGYGDRWMGSQGETQWYTNTFGGTSGASPIVTGAAAAAQGVRRERGLRLLDSFQMRDLLRVTGVAQATGRQIGPLPNLKEAIAVYVNWAYLGEELGTPHLPYRRLPAALADAWNGAQIKIFPGTYSAGGGTISRQVTLMSTGGIVTIVLP